MSKVSAMLTKAKLTLRGLVPYLTHIFSMMRTIETDAVPTMAVDQHNRLYCNEAFMSSLPRMQLAYCLLHEVMHVVLSHCKRFKLAVPQHGEMERFCWNIAADLVIQQLLAKMFGAHEPKGIVRLDGCIPNTNIPYLSVPGLRAGMTVEKYYGLLLPYMAQQPQGSDGKPMPDDGNPLDPAKAGSNSDGQPRDYEQKTSGVEQAMVEHALREAEQQIEGMGKEPGDMAGTIRKSIERRLRPQPDPFKMLSDIVGRASSSPLFTSEERTYMRPHRRQQWDQALRMGVRRLAPECSIIIDTSGSMQGTEMKCFKAIADGLKRVHRPRVIAFDTRVQDAKRIKSLEQFEFRGYGGTDMATAIDQEDRTHHPDCIVVVTDGETRWPARRINARLIIALVRKCPGYATPSYARVVDLTKEVPSYEG